jgi:hypothetical protein
MPKRPNVVLRHGVRQADFAFLKNPFTMASPSQKVRDVLDTNRQACQANSRREIYGIPT